MKLLGLIFGTGLLALMALTMVRIWGQGQTYKPFQTPYFAQETSNSGPEIIVPWEQAFLLEKHPDLILWADTYRAADESLVVRPWIERNTPKNKQTGDGKMDDAQTATGARPLLKDLLLKYPAARFVINCNANQDSIHQQLAKVFQETKSEGRVLLQSDYNTILESVKAIIPMMIYGSTVADLTRIKAMSSLWLLPAAPFKGDVIFVPLQYRNRDTIDRDMAMEMKRRFKKIFVGPLGTPEEVEQAKELGADGFFVEDPFLILKKTP